jgi:indolepyruvate ferredoxin oxidoreductase
MRAIELNAVAVDMNKRAFMLGRLAAADNAALGRLQQPAKVIQFTAPQSLAETVASRVELLTKYQNAAYAARYRELVAAIEARELAVDGTAARHSVAKAAARNLYKVMAYKDEYEVARLHADPVFRAQIAAQFDGDYKLAFHLAPPLLARPKPGSQVPAKVRVGAWLMPVFGVLAKCKPLRGTAFDVFGHTAERKRERALRERYIALLGELADGLAPHNRDVALQLANLPDQVRGYGHIKLAAMDQFDAALPALMAKFRGEQVIELKRSASR